MSESSPGRSPSGRGGGRGGGGRGKSRGRGRGGRGSKNNRSANKGGSSPATTPSKTSSDNNGNDDPKEVKSKTPVNVVAVDPVEEKVRKMSDQVRASNTSSYYNTCICASYNLYCLIIHVFNIVNATKYY